MKTPEEIAREHLMSITSNGKIPLAVTGERLVKEVAAAIELDRAQR